MPVDQSALAAASVTQTAVDAASQVSQTVVDAASQATSAASDQVDSVLDTLISVGQTLNPAQGTTLAIVIAALVVVRMIWKKFKNK